MVKIRQYHGILKTLSEHIVSVSIDFSIYPCTVGFLFVTKWLWLGPYRIAQMLANLLKNFRASKFQHTQQLCQGLVTI